MSERSLRFGVSLTRRVVALAVITFLYAACNFGSSSTPPEPASTVSPDEELSRKGTAHFAAGEYREALRFFKAAYELAKDSTTRARLAHNVAVTAERLNDCSTAEAAFRQSERYDPSLAQETAKGIARLQANGCTLGAPSATPAQPPSPPKAGNPPPAPFGPAEVAPPVEMLVGARVAKPFESVRAYCRSGLGPDDLDGDDEDCPSSRLGEVSHQARWGRVKLVVNDTYSPHTVFAVAFETPRGLSILDGVGLEELSIESAQSIKDVRFEPLDNGHVSLNFVYEAGERVWLTDGPGSEQGWREFEKEERWVCGPVDATSYGCVELGT